MATKTFTVKLFQSHWRRSHTETFPVNAETEGEARKKVEKMVNKKGITEDYDLEVVTPVESTPVGSAVPAPAGDNPNEPQTNPERTPDVDPGPENDGKEPAVRNVNQDAPRNPA